MQWNNSIINRFDWSSEIANRKEKEQVARNIASMAKNGDTIGVGSGSTVYLALIAIAERIKGEGLDILAIPASIEASITCAQLAIPQTTLLYHKPDWTFDGADEVDPNKNLIKGRGGAMFKEKLLIRSSPATYIIVDSSKLVGKLGQRFPIPIEVFPLALTAVDCEVRQLGARDTHLRMAKGKDGPVITENGNLILDAWFETVHPHLEKDIKSITGVVESGLFIDYDLNIVM